jgi:LemA protein
VSSLESEIADRREFYNEAATNYNTALETVPTNVVAGWAGARPRELFTAAAADTADVEVKLKV